MGKQKITTLLQKLFIDNWQRKTISLVLAVIIWFLVNQSLTTSKTIGNIPVRIINIQPGKTISNLQANGILNKRVTLTLIGNKTVLEEMTPSDLEVVIDAENKEGEWIATITKRNLISLNPELDISKGISRVSNANVIIRLVKLVTDKVPVVLVLPTGEGPKDYQYLDIWPYQFDLTVSGPEEVIKRLKSKGVKLTLNLNDISKEDLDRIQTKKDSLKGDEVSFFVPDSWKKVVIPSLSDIPFEIDDPKAKELRIDFVRVALLPLTKPFPISLYFPMDSIASLNSKTISSASNEMIQKTTGTDIFAMPLYAKGVSQQFVRVVESMIQMMIIVEPTSEKPFLDWSVQFINPTLLENRYVSLMMADSSNEEIGDLQSNHREEYLRNRFRRYMSRFQLYKEDDRKLELNITLEQNEVVIRETGQSSFSHYE
ncbi:MAG TPA: hypothetical protein VLG76_06910 [Rhabdochlamydiaceae bacterium]|nr:hypothetical protein [Rhabdochlamydiaceae bacterium]